MSRFVEHKIDIQEDMKMLKSPFTKAVKDFLEDRIGIEKFEEVSQEYALRNRKVSEIEKYLQSLPETVETKNGPVNIKKLLIKIGDENAGLVTIASEIAYQKGFSEGIKFIIYSLIMN
jgi:hypothetical protein